MSINLLPWRKKRALKKLWQLIITLLCVLILSLTITTYVYFHEKSVQVIQKNIVRSLDKKLAAFPSPESNLHNYQLLNNILQKMSALRQSRIALSEQLLTLINKTPLGVSLLRLSISGKEIRIDGLTLHKSALDADMKILSQLFKHEKLSIRIHENSGQLFFSALILFEQNS